MNSTPPPSFKELLAAVTQGKWSNRDTTVNGPMPGWGVSSQLIICTCSLTFKRSEPEANAAYIARLNPATMGLVLEALEAARRLTIETNENRDACAAAMTALDHLNSPTS